MLDSLKNGLPFGKIEMTSDVGLVQNIDKAFIKDSIDRIIRFLPATSSQLKLLLYEMKARVTPTTTLESVRGNYNMTMVRKISQHIHLHLIYENELAKIVRDCKCCIIVTLVSKQSS